MRKACTAMGRYLLLRKEGQDQADRLTLTEALELVEDDRDAAVEQIKTVLDIKDDDVARMTARRIMCCVKKG